MSCGDADTSHSLSPPHQTRDLDHLQEDPCLLDVLLAVQQWVDLNSEHDSPSKNFKDNNDAKKKKKNLLAVLFLLYNVQGMDPRQRKNNGDMLLS